MNKLSLIVISTLTFFVVVSCQSDATPKPHAFLRLDYPEASYITFDSQCPFMFDLNEEMAKKIAIKSNCNITLDYPKMKAKLFLTYLKVDNNLNALLRDAQKLTYEHVVKADDITEIPFINAKNKVYGMFYQVGGNAATNAQFYVTDSLNHFLTGSVYFYARPNYDSIMPANSYIRNDMQRLMETVVWK
jgi:gliding motility-associated lipoprotein GldD